jgi:hypothetical protein
MPAPARLFGGGVGGQAADERGLQVLTQLDREVRVLVGERTQQRALEIFAAYWTNAGEEEQVVAEPLNTKPRYGASTTLPDPLEWQRSTRLQPDAAASRAGGR